MRRAIPTLLFVTLLAAPAAAQPARNPRAALKALEKDAAEAFARDDYATAAERMQEAWALSHDPLHAFNAAAAWFKLERCDAVHTWSQHALDATPPLPEAQRLLALTMMERCPLLAPEPLVPPTPDPDLNPEPDPTPRPLPWRPLASAITLGVGLGVTTWALILDLQLGDDLERLEQLGRQGDDRGAFRDLQAEIADAQPFITGLYTLGTLSLAAGAGLALWSWLDGELEPLIDEVLAAPLQLAPWATPDAAGLGVGGGF